MSIRTTTADGIEMVILPLILDLSDKEMLDWAKHHHGIIARFRRFPHGMPPSTARARRRNSPSSRTAN